MFITIQFKDAKKNFRGRLYDYELCADEREKPKRGDIIRMMDENYNYICNGTRVKVIDVKDKSETVNMRIRYVEASLED